MLLRILDRVAQEAEADSLTAKELAIVEAVKKNFKEKVKVNCTGCAYCMPCHIGINIPICFSTYNDHWIFDGAPEAKYMYGQWTKLGGAASKCESHCPQGLEIRKELKNVKALFE